MLATPVQLEGQVVGGQFRLRRYLGGSDHSSVWFTDRGEPGAPPAALKLVPARAVQSEEQLARWALAAELSHPHLLQLYLGGRCQLGDTKYLYLLMEYAEENLSQVIPQRPLTPQEAREILGPVLETLGYLHARGLVHAGIQLSDILAVGNTLKLSSDSVCRSGERPLAPVHPNAFDPPEVSTEGFSPAGDVWSLGLTLVEALTQRLPESQVAPQGDPDIPQSLPSPFREIARGCLRRDPRLRDSIAEIAAKLNPVSARIAAPQTQPPRTARVPARTPRGKLPVIVGVVVLVLLAFVGLPRLFRHNPAPPQSIPFTAEPQRPPAKPERKAVGTGAPTTRRSPAAENKSPSANAPSAPASKPGVATRADSSGIARGEVLRQVLPDVPASARETIRGTVRVSVKVNVDRSGSVFEATLDSPGPSRYFAALALDAARKWEFDPPRQDGKSVVSEWILRFEFTNSSTRAFPSQSAP